MNSQILYALILGAIEGVTEFLPISSTGYLILTNDLLGFLRGPEAEFFIVVIQVGAILAVVYEYWGRLWGALVGFATGRGQDRALGLSLIVASVPAVVVGLLFSDFISAHLFHPLVVAGMLILGATLIFYVEGLRPVIRAQEAERIPLKMAFLIGLCQCLALIPGTSRSGATIIGALFLGASRKAATEFSFFLGIPILFGAAGLEIIKHKEVLQDLGLHILGAGVVCAFVVALVCIRFMVSWVSRHDFRLFGYVRLITGLLVLIVYYGAGYQMGG